MKNLASGNASTSDLAILSPKSAMEQTDMNVSAPVSHTPVIRGGKGMEIQNLKSKLPPSIAAAKDSKEQSKDSVAAVAHPKKWGERTTSWKPAQFESVAALIEKGWQDVEEKKTHKLGSRKASTARGSTNTTRL